MKSIDIYIENKKYIVRNITYLTDNEEREDLKRDIKILKNKL